MHASLAGRRRALLRSTWLKLAVQLLIGLALIAVLLSLDFGGLLRLLAGADPGLVALVVVLTFLYTYLLSERWRLILRGMGVRVPTLPAFDLTMRGYFFGTVLPSNAGGDVVKAYLLSRRGAPLSVALLSAVLDRVAGLAALAWLGGVAGWLALAPADLAAGATTYGLLLLAAATTLGGLLGPTLVGWLEAPLLRLTPRFLRAPLAGACSALRALGSRPLIYLVAVLVSVPLQLFYVFQMHLLLLALHVSADPYRLTWAVTWATLAGALPISFSGFGPRETAFAAALGSRDVGVAIGLLSGAMQVISGLPGGVLQLLERGAGPTPSEVESPLGEPP
jgi:glycosyltransferase 2 family protein